MSTWNIKLVNFQRKTRGHIRGLNSMLTSMPCFPETNGTKDELVRIPVNSKSMFSLEEQNAGCARHQHCNSFLGSVEINGDLVDHPSTFCKLCYEEAYVAPASQEPHIAQDPEELATDLYRCTSTKECIYIVEDKDPSVLWQMGNYCIFDYWYNIMASCSDRWGIQHIGDIDILKKNTGAS